MKKTAIISALLLIPALCYAAIFTGSYNDVSGVYHAPASSRAAKDGAAVTETPTFSNGSTASGPNPAGRVMWNWSTPTTSAKVYTFYAAIKDSTGKVHEFETNLDTRMIFIDAAVSGRSSQTSVTALGSPLQAGSYTAPDNASVTAIKAKTDNLRFRNGTTVMAYASNESAGGGAGGTTIVNVVPFQGKISFETAVQGSEAKLYKGDKWSIYYQLTKGDGTAYDLSGSTAWFGLKADPGDAAYVYGPANIAA